MTPTLAPTPTRTLKTEAADILAEAPISFLHETARADQKARQDAARNFLDTDEPGELVEALAEQRARERFEELCNRREALPVRHSYDVEDFDDAWGHTDDFDDWYDDERDTYLAAVRSTFGMGGVCG